MANSDPDNGSPELVGSPVADEMPDAKHIDVEEALETEDGESLNLETDAELFTTDRERADALDVDERDILPIGTGGGDGVGDKTEAERLKEAAEAADDARFEERKKRRLAAADLEDTSSLIPKKKFLAIAVGIGFLYFAVNFLDVWTTSRSHFEGDASAAVVLGAAQYNGEPSGALRGRLDRAAELYTDGAVEKIVVTGGRQEADITTEAKTGYDYLRSTSNIPDDDLLLEVQGATTYEQLSAVARFLETESTPDIVIVTDPYHARRSVLIAEEVGLDAAAAITNNRSDKTRLISESVAISIGRLISFRRFDAYLN